MEHDWIKSTHAGESERLLKIAKDAVENAQTTKNTPTKEVLDEDVQKHIEDRFPKTTDDTLQEDLAQQFVLNSNYLDELHKKFNTGEQIQGEINSTLWNIYEEQMKLGAYIEVHKDLNKRVRTLIDTMQTLELTEEIAEKFPMAKSGISNKEALALAHGEAENLKRELDGIKNEEVTKESVGELLDRYKKISEHYAKARYAIEPEFPERN
jgi:hypothetical protein